MTCREGLVTSGEEAEAMRKHEGEAEAEVTENMLTYATTL